MPKGVWSDQDREKRRAAARKGAANRSRRAAFNRALTTGVLVPDAAEINARQGCERDRVLTGPQLSEILAKVRAAADRQRAATEGDG